MKVKVRPIKPSVIVLYGYPGSGKTTFARHLSKEIKYAHLEEDKISYELSKINKQIRHNEVKLMMLFLARQLIDSGVGVVFDMDLPKESDRKKIKDFAKKYKVDSTVIWVQIDAYTAETRLKNRGKTKPEDKFAKPNQKKLFDEFVGNMQNPKDDQVVVISGKHNFSSQRSAVVKKLYQKGLVKYEDLTDRVIKPELMSLVPNPTLSGRSGLEKRNISIN